VNWKERQRRREKEGDLHERYPNFLLLYALVWLRRRRVHVFHKLINIAAFPTLTHSLTLVLEIWFRLYMFYTSVCIQSKISLSINTSNIVFLHPSSLPNILLNPVRPAKHGVFTTVPLSISLFHYVSLPFPFNNFFISFLCSWPKSFFAPIQRILFH
jgi:hypothetical protein